jgi:transcriptional regulator with XRE-family HTH domain
MESPNATRLRAAIRLFRLSPKSIARATGFSPSYISRLLSPRDNFEGSSEFYRRLEAKLGTIIENRSSQFFSIPAVPVQRARDVMEASLSL